MKLINAQIERFRSFLAPAFVEFTGGGLVFVTGRNLVEPALGANGAGKSTLFEAIYWCLFGKTSRGLRAGAIKPWGAEGVVSVSLTLEAFGKTWVVGRTWGPNRLWIEDPSSEEQHEIDQPRLEELLGVSPETFLYSCYFAQFSPSFLDLKPADQMALFSEVLKLGIWDAAVDLASKEAREADKKAQALELGVSNKKGRLSALLVQSEVEEERSRAAAISRYHAAVNTKVALVQIRESLAQAEAELKKAGEGDAKSRNNLRGMLTELQDNLEQAVQHLAEWKAELKSLVPVKASTHCHFCGAPLKPDLVKKARAQEAVTEKRRKELKGLISEAESWIADWKVEREDLNKALDEEKADPALLQRVSDCKTMLASTRATFDGILREAVPEPSGVEAEVQGLREELRSADAELRATQALAEGARYWQKEFKELRLFLVEESLTQLEVEVNSALHELGLEEWAVEFDVEREKKSGEIKTGFSVLIHSPVTDQAVPWEAWSGGESQRLRLAVAMGFASLINEGLGLDTSTEFWDEPSTWLSTSGITDLMQTLKSRADNTGKQIWIADHRTLEYGGFSRVVTVTKTHEGSTLS